MKTKQNKTKNKLYGVKTVGYRGRRRDVCTDRRRRAGNGERPAPLPYQRRRRRRRAASASRPTRELDRTRARRVTYTAQPVSFRGHQTRMSSVSTYVYILYMRARSIHYCHRHFSRLTACPVHHIHIYIYIYIRDIYLIQT